MKRRDFVRLASTAAGATTLAEATVCAHVAASVQPMRQPPSGKALMKVGTQHGHTDAILRACAGFGVNHICSSLPSPTFDDAWSVDSLSRLRDRVASFGGSWTFIGLFAIVMISWMVINQELRRPFDPYPYILLNLVLSCLAALQAPVIMMSQNRQAARDRSDARNDYEVNLRAEMEIGAVHTKLDLLREQEWLQLVRALEEQKQVLAAIQARLDAIAPRT